MENLPDEIIKIIYDFTPTNCKKKFTLFCFYM